MSKRIAEAILAGMIVCAAGCGGGGNGKSESNPGADNANVDRSRPPIFTPVKMLPPSARPDLNINAVLFSNGTAIGCNELVSVTYTGPGEVFHPESSQAKVARAINTPMEAQSHAEPPIGGRDGSFRLAMAVQKNLAGSNAKTLKFCGVPHDTTPLSGTWALFWKIWNSDGTVYSTNETAGRGLDLPGLKDVRIRVNFNDPSEGVTIFRTVTPPYGSAWNAQSKKSDFVQVAKTPINQGVRIDSDLAAGHVRMTSLTITETPFNDPVKPPETIPLTTPVVTVPGSPATCAAFVICHDSQPGVGGLLCPALSKPPNCSGAVQGTTNPPTSH